QPGYPNPAVRGRAPRSNYDGTGTAIEGAPSLNVIDKGSRSIFNSERAMHRNNFKLKLTNASGTFPANIVLTTSLPLRRSL
ncbi:hypothetical protein N9933_03665, partial [bacterium]|nr:hypothetical protein [bacterium]